MHRSRISCRPMFGTTQRRNVTTTACFRSGRLRNLVGIDLEEKTLQPRTSPSAKSVTDVSGRSVTYVSGTDGKGLAPHLGTTHPIATGPFHPVGMLAVRRAIGAAALKHGFHKLNGSAQESDQACANRPFSA